MVDNRTVLHYGGVEWFKQPQLDHMVHFYPFSSDLITALFDYISEGILSGDTCYVIATERHTKLLHDRFVEKGIDYTKAMESGQYLNFDANETLSYLVVEGKIDSSRFPVTIDKTVEQAAKRGKPIRVFGEMVALLWKEGDTESMLQLEEYWNGLMQKHPLSLLCAYPELHFDGSTSHKKSIESIKHTHALTTGSFA